ncbi:MAG: Sec-independent protein translocase protein TatB [Dehalococcoidales bacterium]
MGLDLGFLEILVILVVALLVVGPDKLPEYARQFGKMMRDLRRMTRNFTGEVTKSLDMEDDFDDLKNTAKEIKGSLDSESLKIKNALDAEADEIAKTIDDEIRGVKERMDDETAQIADMLEKDSLEFNAATLEIKDSLKQGAQEVSSTLNEGTEKLNEFLKTDAPAIVDTVKKPLETPARNIDAPDDKTITPAEKSDTEGAE